MPTRIDQYNEKLKELYANRDERFRRTPKSRELEEKIADEMVAIFSLMTKEEREQIERPEPPRYQTSLIAQDHYGRLIGYEDLEDY